MTDKSYFSELRLRTVNQNIKSMFVTEKGLEEAILCVSKEWTRAVTIEPPDLDGYFKVKAVDDSNN